MPPELDLVDAEDQVTHELSLDDEMVAETGLDVFKVDPDVRQRRPHNTQHCNNPHAAAKPVALVQVSTLVPLWSGTTCMCQLGAMPCRGVTRCVFCHSVKCVFGCDPHLLLEGEAHQGSRTTGT